MTEFERLRVFLNASIDPYIIIPSGVGVKAPKFPYITMLQIPSAIDNNVLVLRTRKDANTITESITRRVELYIQFDSFHTDEEQAYNNACDMQEQLYTILREKLNLEGFGVLEQRSSNDITNRSSFENSTNLYRFGFDCVIDCKRDITKDIPDIDSIKVKELNYENNEEDQEIIINKEE